jgi:hypothetical protein
MDAVPGRRTGSNARLSWIWPIGGPSFWPSQVSWIACTVGSQANPGDMPRRGGAAHDQIGYVADSGSPPRPRMRTLRDRVLHLRWYLAGPYAPSQRCGSKWGLRSRCRERRHRHGTHPSEVMQRIHSAGSAAQSGIGLRNAVVARIPVGRQPESANALHAKSMERS